MASKRATFEWDDKKLRVNVDRLPDKVDAMIKKTLEYHASRGEAAMKKNAKWNDQTGNARQSLHASVESSPGKHTLTLAHGMPYGIWLEVRWSGRLAIIRPTLQTLGPEVMGTLNNGMSRLGRQS